MKRLFYFFVFLALQAPLSARNPYHAKVTVDIFSEKFSASTFLNLTEELTTKNIGHDIPNYTPNTPASIALNLRGLEATIAFQANSTTLVFTMPQTGLTETFTGATRDQSLALFRDFISNNKDGLRRLHKAQRKFTPIDPVAGNPNSLLALMPQADYLLGRLTPLSGCDCCWSAQPVHYLFQTGFLDTEAMCRGFNTTNYSFPLRYSFSPDHRWAFILDMPLNVIVDGRAFCLDTSLGLGVRMPVTPNWSLTPILRTGVNVSIDLSTGGSFISTGVTSCYDFHIRNWVLSVIDYAGYITSLPLHAGGINFDYHLHNFVFKNGLALTSCQGWQVCGRPVNLSLTYENSAFTGSTLFIEHFNEVGLALITQHIIPCLCYDLLSLNVSYQFGHRSYKAYTIGLIYQF